MDGYRLFWAPPPDRSTWFGTITNGLQNLAMGLTRSMFEEHVDKAVNYLPEQFPHNGYSFATRVINGLNDFLTDINTLMEQPEIRDAGTEQSAKLAAGLMQLRRARGQATWLLSAKRGPTPKQEIEALRGLFIAAKHYFNLDPHFEMDMSTWQMAMDTIITSNLLPKVFRAMAAGECQWVADSMVAGTEGEAARNGSPGVRLDTCCETLHRNLQMLTGQNSTRLWDAGLGQRMAAGMSTLVQPEVLCNVLTVVDKIAFVRFGSGTEDVRAGIRMLAKRDQPRSQQILKTGQSGSAAALYALANLLADPRLARALFFMYIVPALQRA